LKSSTRISQFSSPVLREEALVRRHPGIQCALVLSPGGVGYIPTCFHYLVVHYVAFVEEEPGSCIGYVTDTVRVHAVDGVVVGNDVVARFVFADTLECFAVAAVDVGVGDTDSCDAAPLVDCDMHVLGGVDTDHIESFGQS